MKRTRKTKQAAYSDLSRAAQMVLGGIALGFVCLAASAQSEGAATDALERKFWQCDWEATTWPLDVYTAAECSVATEALRRQRFGGDFNAMLAWWRQAKPAAHQALAAEAAERAQRVADPASNARTSVDPLRQRLEALAAGEVKQIYLQCSNEAVERRLDSSEVVMCSIAYDVLLKKHFGGSFDALHAWSRRQGGVDGRSAVDLEESRRDEAAPVSRVARPAVSN